MTQLADLTVTSEEGERLAARALALVAKRRRWPARPRGRWPLLVWFCSQERILTESELADALSRLT